MALYSYKCPHNSGRNSLECEIELYKTSVRQLKPLANIIWQYWYNGCSHITDLVPLHKTTQIACRKYMIWDMTSHKAKWFQNVYLLG